MEVFRRATQALRWVPDKRTTEVDHALPGDTLSGETSNRWTQHENWRRRLSQLLKALDGDEWREWAALNVLVTGWTKVR